MNEPNDPNQAPAPLEELISRKAASEESSEHLTSEPSRPMEDAGTQALSEALGSSFKIVKVLMVIMVVIFLGSGFKIINPNEVGVKLRFGKPVGTGDDQVLKQGFHFAFPYPIDEIVRIPVGESRSMTSTAGWYAISEQEKALGIDPMPIPYLRPGVDGYTMTADGNIIHARIHLKYRVTDPVRYEFGFANVTNLLENVLNNALFYASSRFLADEAIYKDKLRFKEVVLNRVNEKLTSLNLGITMDPSEVETRAPLDVEEAFDQVLAAEQDRSKRINEAEGNRDEIVRRAEGEARALMSAGVTSSNQIVQAVAAEATYFQAQLPNFQRDPDLFKRRLLTETSNRILTNSQEKFFLPDRIDHLPRELRLMLSREPEKPRTSQPAQ